jgi:hypothetical protein
MARSELVAGRRPVIQDVRAGPVTFGQPRVQEYAQVAADGAEREAGDGG